MPKRAVTYHAIERYIDRVGSRSIPNAKDELLLEFSSAIRGKEKARGNAAVYHTDRMRLVVREERDIHTVITVLPLKEGAQSPPELEIELALESNAAIEAARKREEQRLSQRGSDRAAMGKTIQRLERQLAEAKEVIRQRTRPKEGMWVPVEKYEKQLQHGTKSASERDKYRLLLRGFLRAGLAESMAVLEESLAHAMRLAPELFEIGPNGGFLALHRMTEPDSTIAKHRLANLKGGSA